MKKQNAFTLVELSIVLVIIGLVIGAVSVGTSLLDKANITSVVSDIEKYVSATNSFRDRYGSWPGDMPDATSYWSGTGNGNGDGRVAPRGSQEAEHFRFWQHLQKAGFIEGQYSGVNAVSGPAHAAAIGVNVPESAIEGVGYYSEYIEVTDTSSWFWNGFHGQLVYIGRLNSGFIPGGNASFYSKDAEAIDAKIDDALPAFGAVTTKQDQSNCNTSTSDPDAADYNFAYTQADACSLFFLIE